MDVPSGATCRDYAFRLRPNCWAGDPRFQILSETTHVRLDLDA